MQPPYVGILVNEQLYRGIPLGETNYEEISLYIEAGAKFGIQPCFFRLQDFHPDSSHIAALVNQGGSFIRQQVPTPKVIHNRAIYPGAREKRKLEAGARQGYQFFNRWNRYGKLYIHQVLMKSYLLLPHLPETMQATEENMYCMMRKYDSLIIKPNRSSIGRGIMKLWKTEAGWKLSYPDTLRIDNTKWHTVACKGFSLPKVLRKRIGKSKYIVQQCLPLASCEGRPFDLRVSVQRGANGSWQITGMIARVASKHAFITNVGQGGTPCRIEPLLNTVYPGLLAEEIIEGVRLFSLNVAEHLSRRMPHLADLGLDIGLDKDGFPLFIECNGKDQRYTLKQAGLVDAWRASYENPMAYASFLLQRGGAKSQ